MIETYFSRMPTLTQFRGGPLGTDLDELAKTLHQQGYAQDSIRRYVGCVPPFTHSALKRAVLLMMPAVRCRLHTQAFSFFP